MYLEKDALKNNGRALLKGFVSSHIHIEDGLENDLNPSVSEFSKLYDILEKQRASIEQILSNQDEIMVSS